MKIKYLIFIFLCCMLFSCASDRYSEIYFENLIQLYRGPLKHLSSVRAAECPMYPSCSDYSLQSFRKYGLLIGWIMTCDRLMRCGRDEIYLAPTIWIDGKRKYYDPVDDLRF